MSEESGSINEILVKKATTQGQLTFATREFGWGTNFICSDSKVDANGGVHIIQTFWAESKSEEVQIQGRTSGYGKVGTYQIILLENDLEIL